MKPEPLTEDELVHALKAEGESACNYYETVVADEQEKAIEYYDGKPFGAEDVKATYEYGCQPDRPAQWYPGQVEVEVTFSISVDGIVSVSAKDLETGREQSITVTATSGLTEDELKDLVKQSQSYMIELRASEESERRRQQAEKLIDTIRGLFPQVQEAMSGTRFGRDAIAKAEAVVVRAEQDLARSDGKNLLDTIESLDRTLGMFKNVMHKKSEAAHR